MDVDQGVGTDTGLSLVNTVGDDCRIYRETSGRYVVRMDRDPPRQLAVATLACAYAACRSWQGSDALKPDGGCLHDLSGPA